MSGKSTVSVVVRDADKIEQRLRKLQSGSETAIKRTVSDFRSRATGWINKGIKQHYGVDSAGVKSASVSIQDTSSGSTLAGISIRYRGRTLTLTHFNMSPKEAPAGTQGKYIRIPGQTTAVAMVKPPKKYSIKATVIKGQRVEMSSKSFLAKGLPFQRQGSGRHPVTVIHTLSVPQMIDGKSKDTIEQIINENIEKRFEHTVNQIMK